MGCSLLLANLVTDFATFYILDKGVHVDGLERRGLERKRPGCAWL